MSATSDGDSEEHRVSAIVRSFPKILLDKDAFVSRLRERGVDLETVQGARLRDIYLAEACLAGDSAAAALFVSRFRQDVRTAVQRVARAFSSEDLVQRVIMELIVTRDGAPPRIAGYRGSGSLRGFVRMVASRIAIDERRKGEGRPVVPEDPLEVGPELLGFVDRTLLATEMEALLKSALGGLPELERRALRLRFGLGFSAPRTARILGVHTNSVSRLVARARRRVLEQVINLGTLPTDPSSLVALARFVDLSVDRLLASSSE